MLAFHVVIYSSTSQNLSLQPLSTSVWLNIYIYSVRALGMRSIHYMSKYASSKKTANTG